MSLRWLLLIFVIAIGLTVLFWAPLWQGGGLIGGDLYPYFFPQKTLYAEQIANGESHLWNNLVGFGYPQLAESQTGVYYPPNPLLYRVLSVNDAYNVCQIGHYVLAFVFTWLLMRRLDLSPLGAVLGAIVFVYGWFPPRICLEWAIIGGVYLPLCLWCVESFLQNSQRGWLLVMAMVMGVHLLAGHFNLAFITQLTVLGYVLLRVLMSWESLAGSVRNRNRLFVILPVMLAIAGGFALASVQLLPTWELKQLSQREDIGAYHDPGYGHLPPWYLSQVVAPWMWYSAETDPDQALSSIKSFSIASATNKAEAHLYFGMVPLALILYRLALVYLGHSLDRRQLSLLLLGFAAVIYSTGWLLPITRHLPGFSFFMGPGRYGIVTTLAASVLTGAGLDEFLARRPGSVKTIVTAVVLVLTLFDLHWVSRAVTYAVMIPDPPINHRHESEIGRIFTDYESAESQARPVRVWAPFANVLTMLNVSAYPTYLGLGPYQYFDNDLMMPKATDDMSPSELKQTREAQLQWLHDGSFTHILRTEPLNLNEWPDVRLVWQGFDRFLNPVFGRREPMYLYELADSLPRIHTEPATEERVDFETTGDRMSASLPSTNGGELVWTDLAHPGWMATIENSETVISSETRDGLFRTVDVPTGMTSVRWDYESSPYRIGAILSALALTAWMVCAVWLRYRRTNGA
ncbi:MAG: hypothetical protein R3C02_17660 [Planctomycetaceae bacterium]